MIYIPYGRQNISEEDIEAVVGVLRSEYLTQGPVVPLFESAVAKYCGAEFAYALNSATSALHVACLALGVSNGDTVWTSAITFAASSNCALYCGADVDFIDIDPSTYNMDLDLLEMKLARAAVAGELPKAIIAVHMCGQPLDMPRLKSLSDRFGFYVIEDASHAIGSRYLESVTGSCRYSDIVIFSFHPVKIITTGEGGMVLTNNASIARKINLLRTHGITRDPAQMRGPPDGPWYYEQIELGFNYRMTDIQAALGLSQMKNLDSFVRMRHEVASRYFNLLNRLPIKFPTVDDKAYNAYHLFVIRLESSEIRKSHLEVFNELRDRGVGVNLHYLPVYLHPYYQNLGFSKGLCPEAERYYSEALSLPMHSALKLDEQEYVAHSIREVLRA